MNASVPWNQLRIAVAISILDYITIRAAWTWLRRVPRQAIAKTSTPRPRDIFPSQREV